MGGGTGSPGNRRESLDGLSRRDSSGRRSIQVPVDRSLRFSRANDIGPPQMWATAESEAETTGEIEATFVVF